MTVRQHIRHLLKHLWFQLLFRSGATAWAKFSLRRQGASVVLTFHRILTDLQLETTNSPAGMIVKKNTFADLLNYLAPRVSFGSLCSPGESNHKLKLFVTFDDGWQDNLSNAIPLLQKKRIPACIFVCPGLVGCEQPFWPETAVAIFREANRSRRGRSAVKQAFIEHGLTLEHWTEKAVLDALKHLPPATRSALLDSFSHSLRLALFATDRTMDWTELQQAVKSDVLLGTHTHRHTLLKQLSPAEQKSELQSSLQCLENKLGLHASVFSYPNGDWNESARANVKTVGNQLAFINSPGIWSPLTDPLLIPRVNLSEQKLVGLTGKFSAASASYFLLWQPYTNRTRSLIH